MSFISFYFSFFFRKISKNIELIDVSLDTDVDTTENQEQLVQMVMDFQLKPEKLFAISRPAPLSKPAPGIVANTQPKSTVYIDKDTRTRRLDAWSGSLPQLNGRVDESSTRIGNCIKSKIDVLIHLHM